MKIKNDLTTLEWKLSSYHPYLWQFQTFQELENSPDAHIVRAKVPGSVQYSLREAGLLPDWNVGQNARECEWVENRHWIYETIIPDDWVSSKNLTYRLNCLGLDYKGWVYLNGKQVSEFCGSHTAYQFDITPFLVEQHNILRIVFDLSPRWLGQFGYTSRIREWKPRFNFSWDWIPRFVQIGISDGIYLEATDGKEITEYRCFTDVDIANFTGMLRANGRVTCDDGTIQASLLSGKEVINTEKMPSAHFNGMGLIWRNLPVKLWYPNMMGKQPMYTLRCVLCDENGEELDRFERRVGFRNVAWEHCEGAPDNADPWICVVNGQRVFLQGVNYSPVLPNYADVKREDHQKRLKLYHDLGMNIFRINACGFLESEDFFDICDELGLMVWQEFPLTSSGAENIPPDDVKSIYDMTEIARSFILRRQHHPSLIIWCGGNELLDSQMKPLNVSQPMLAALQKVVHDEDPTRRYVAVSPSGPTCWPESKNFGKGLHWDVHGPWKPVSDLKSWATFWGECDALFHSEMGSPSASPIEIIRKYIGDCKELPISVTNPYWSYPISWWLEVDRFTVENGHAPESLEEYANWSQERQAQALSIAVKACKDRFPRCGGVILWMGHDCFPCPTNTSIIDFHGEPKPAALALAKIFRSQVTQ